MIIDTTKMVISIKNKYYKAGKLTFPFWWNEKCSEAICNRFIGFWVYRLSKLVVDFIEFKRKQLFFAQGLIMHWITYQNIFQRSCLSLILFNIYMTRINSLLNNSGFFSLCYADNIVFFSKNKYLKIVNNKFNKTLVLLS